MKTIGLIGGMSWESTVTYYDLINKIIQKELGGFHSAKILLYSVDFAEIEDCQSKGEWDKSAEILIRAAKSLEAGGADFIVICTNTMHKVVPQIEKNINIPILHIADATAAELIKNQIKKVALLGTKYTMTQDFYKDRIRNNNIEVLIPNEEQIEIVNQIIYNELCLGEVKDSSRIKYEEIITDLQKQGAQAVILGCTEIGLLISQKDSAIPVFDTTKIHAQEAAKKALEKV